MSLVNFSSNQCRRGGKKHKVPKKMTVKPQYLNKLAPTPTIINGRTPHPRFSSHNNSHSSGVKPDLEHVSKHGLNRLFPFPFLSAESTALLAFQAFTSRKKKKRKDQCRAGPIAMYVCLFSSQMSKINAGGKRET